MRYLSLVVLLLVSFVSFGQAPSNYTNINGRYRWIAGMFDSTFHIPKGSTPSLRTGGSTNAGALFYKTGDSSLYIYTGTQWLKQAGTAGFVPYSGATQNVDLGQFGLKTKYVEFDTSSQAVTDRRLQWSNDEGTLQFGMTNGSTITQRIGLEQFARVKNVSGSQINKGQAVYIFGASGDRASVKLADNRADSTSSKTLGVATEDIAINDVGLVGTFGVVSNLDLSAFTAGDILYLDSIPGGLTKTKPQAPYHLVFIGVVERANSGNGLLFVNPQNGYELEELHNVRITSPVNNKSILMYDSVAMLWVDTTIAGAGLAVTSVATNTGTGITGGTITSSGTIAADTLLLSTRAWRQKGVDSLQANINTKQNTLTLTTFGTGGVATLVGATLNIPQYQGALTNPITGTGTANYVAKFSGLTGITNSQIFDNSTNVGIGTATPDSLLTVNLGTHLKRGVRMSGLPTGVGTKSLRVDANGTLSVADTLANGISGTGTTNYIPKFTSSSAIGNSLMQEVFSGISFGGPIYAQDGTSTSASIRFYNSNSGLYHTGSDGLGFITNGNERMRLDASGNLGINTSSPNTYSGYTALTINNSSTGALLDLDVADVRTATIATTVSEFTLGSITNIPIAFITNSSERMRLDASGNLGLGTSSPSAKLDVLGNVRVGGSGNPSLTISGTDGAYTGLFYINAAGGGSSKIYANGGSNTLILGTNSTDRVTLDASGNLGLGVTPSAWSLGKAIDINGGPGILGLGNSTQITNNAYYNGGWLYKATSYAQNFVLDNDGSFKFNQAPSGTAGNAISFTQAMTLNASGRLGIGITSPTEKLSVAGNGYFLNSGVTELSIRTPNSTFNDSYLSFGTDVYNRAQIRVSGANASTGFMAFTTFDAGSGAERMRITSGGQVGIGTSSPTSYLTGVLAVNSSGDNYVSIVSPSANAAGLMFQDVTGTSIVGGIRYTHSDDVISLWNAGSEKMRITSGGELLINTTSDAGDYKLQVNGNGYFSNSSASGYTYITLANTGTSGRAYDMGVGGNTATAGYANSWYIFDNTASSRRLTLTSSGNLEINDGSIKTAAPSGGNAAAWKLGERVASAGVTFNDQQYIQLDIAGTTYYLATVDLPMPEAYPQATSGPSNNYKITPVQVKTTRDAEIEKLRKEIEELKQLIKNK